MKERPALIAHADWGKDTRKRWLATARWRGDRYEAMPATPVTDTPGLLRSLMAQADGGVVLAGFDFPIGLPAAYASVAGIENFRQFLEQSGMGCWDNFYEVARERSEISLHRPFYPYKAGGRKQTHLLEALELQTMDQLHRRCERATSSRSAASTLFWTLGAKQAGRAAIAGWQEVLQPALAEFGDRIALWPFDGRLRELLRTRTIVVCETYPANGYVTLGLRAAGRQWSKRNPEHRRRHAPAIRHWGEKNAVDIKQLSESLDTGFGDGSEGEDAFDATIGLLSMVHVVQGNEDLDKGLPTDVLNCEGWMLGQAP